MSTITYDIAATAQAATPTAAPVRKRKGLFARFMEARQKLADAGARPPRPAAAARAGRGRAEDQRTRTRIRCRSCADSRGMTSHRNVSGCLGFGRMHLGKVLLLIFRGLCSDVRHYAAGAMVLCSIAPADGTSNRYYGATRKLVGSERQLPPSGIAHGCARCSQAEFTGNNRRRAARCFAGWIRWRRGRCAIRTGHQPRSGRQRHHHRRDPAVQRERALQHQPLRPVGGERRVRLRGQIPDSTIRAFGISCRATGAASLCSGRSRIFAIARSNGAR